MKYLDSLQLSEYVFLLFSYIVQEVQQYILKEVKKVYSVQGIDISDKHIEVIIKQMLK